jgi:hypothetical protein
MLAGPLKWYAVAAALRDAAATALVPQVCRYGVVAGNQAAWDDCQCGALYVNVLRTYPSEEFPAPVEAPVGAGCSPSLDVAEIVLQVLRCATQPENPQTEAAPGQDALDADAQQWAQDAYNLVASVERELCTMKDDGAGEILDYLVQELTAVGPDGACVGSELHVLVSLTRG